MPATVYLYNNQNYSKCLGQTSKAFNCVMDKELMREYKLSFEITNDNPILKILPQKKRYCAFKSEGQLFDVNGIDTDSGDSNVVKISAEHVSYRLSDYMIPDNYSFVGTLSEIVLDILEQGVNINDEKASTVFNVGECYDGLGVVTYGLIDQENITVRAALLGLTYLGVEVDFDNFNINCPLKIGNDIDIPFDFDTNLKNFRRSWDRDNGDECTYEVSNIDRGDIVLGANAVVTDSFIGDVVKKRIISYSRCVDNPINNKVSLGVFSLDSAAASVDTGLELDALNKSVETLNVGVDNSLQQGEQYNNVSVTHELGFMSERKDGTVRVIENGTDCFAVQVKQNGQWKTMVSATENGFCAERPDGLLRVIMNAEKCFIVQVKKSGQWVTVTETTDEGLATSILTSVGSQYYGIVGGKLGDRDKEGFTLVFRSVDTAGNWPEEQIIQIRYTDNSEGTLIKSNLPLVIQSPDVSIHNEDDEKIGYTGSFVGGRIHVVNGLVSNHEDGNYYTGQINIQTLSGLKRFTFNDGLLSGVSEE